LTSQTCYIATGTANCCDKKANILFTHGLIGVHKTCNIDKQCSENLSPFWGHHRLPHAKSSPDPLNPIPRRFCSCIRGLSTEKSGTRGESRIRWMGWGLHYLTGFMIGSTLCYLWKGRRVFAFSRMKYIRARESQSSEMGCQFNNANALTQCVDKTGKYFIDFLDSSLLSFK
jgi:hypothetical protein